MSFTAIPADSFYPLVSVWKAFCLGEMYVPIDDRRLIEFFTVWRLHCVYTVFWKYNQYLNRWAKELHLRRTDTFWIQSCLKITSTCLQPCMYNYNSPMLQYVCRLNLTRSRLSALHYSLSYFWNGCVSFFFFFLLALIDWCVIFSSGPLGTVLHRAQCLKAWNHCEDLMQSCRIISGLLGSFPHNHLNGFPRVVSAIGVCMQKGNLISITAYFSFSTKPQFW